MIEAYVTNLGKYTEGVLAGEYLKLPASTEDVQALLKRIHVDGVCYEEIFITDYETEIEGLYDCLGEYESIDELNYMAALLGDMDEGDRERFEAAIAYGEYTGNLKDLINLAQNLDCYEYYPDISDEEDLGYYMVDELDALRVPEHLKNYFDYEAFGRDVSLEDGGVFTGGGYVVSTGDSFTEHYNGKDIPGEYRIFAYPAQEKTPIMETLKMYQRMIDEKAPAADRPRPVVHEGR